MGDLLTGALVVAGAIAFVAFYLGHRIGSAEGRLLERQDAEKRERGSRSADAAVSSATKIQ
jgi:hypothetical protein